MTAARTVYIYVVETDSKGRFTGKGKFLKLPEDSPKLNLHHYFAPHGMIMYVPRKGTDKGRQYVYWGYTKEECLVGVNKFTQEKIHKLEQELELLRNSLVKP